MPENDKSSSKLKSVLDTLDVVSKIVAAVAIPWVIILVGNSYNASIKESENRVRYVELAIALLKEPPSTDNAVLRDWAVEMLDSHAPIKLPKEAKERLRSRQLSVNLSAHAVAVASGSGALSLSGQK